MFLWKETYLKLFILLSPPLIVSAPPSSLRFRNITFNFINLLLNLSCSLPPHFFLKLFVFHNLNVIGFNSGLRTSTPSRLLFFMNNSNINIFNSGRGLESIELSIISSSFVRCTTNDFLGVSRDLFVTKDLRVVLFCRLLRFC